jgi:predicted dehydrogenase
MNRRTFVSSLAVAGVAVATSSKLFSAETKPRPKVGLIGCGWYGGVILENFARFAQVEIVSLCDVNARAQKRLLGLVAKYQQAIPHTFTDYRAMLAATHHDIVIVATPDHWHALAAIAAIKAGADVFLEKPVGVDVIEGEALVSAARKYDRTVQVNTHRRSNPMNVKVREEYVRSGKLGRIGLVEAYSFLGGRLNEILPAAEPPPYLDYELWTGPAPLRPFLPLMESKGWRSFMEYGNGLIGDLGVHLIDHARWMLGLGWPESVHSTGGIYVSPASSSNISDTQRSVFRYPHLDLSWEHRSWGLSPIPARHWTDQWGTRFHGTNGTLYMTMYGYEFVPVNGGLREGFHMLSRTGNPNHLDFSREGTCYDETNQQHVTDFMTARLNHSRPVSDIAEAHISTACAELANLSQELGRPLVYDAKTRTVPGDPEATRRLARTYRSPWVHPDPAAV